MLLVVVVVVVFLALKIARSDECDLRGTYVGGTVVFRDMGSGFRCVLFSKLFINRDMYA